MQTNGEITRRKTRGMDRYRQHAANCLNSARTAASANTRLALIDMARVWVMLAEEAERNGGRLLEGRTPNSAR